MPSHLLSDSSDLRGGRALEFGSVLSETDQDETENLRTEMAATRCSGSTVRELSRSALFPIESLGVATPDFRQN